MKINTTNRSKEKLMWKAGHNQETSKKYTVKLQL